MGMLVGRTREQGDLEEWCRSSKAELICVYGRRRVGKTYLVETTFRDMLAFSVSGSDDRRNRIQLKAFHAALRRYGCTERSIPQDWFEAFERLRMLLESPDVVRAEGGRRVVFLDEFPWLAAKRSDFLPAFYDFWNGWASKRDDIVVIICGSATSWIVKNVFENTKSMFNRVTRQLYVAPFDLHDTEEMARSLHLGWGRDAILQCYMVFGGMPYYIDMLDRRKSLAQNIDALCLDTRAPLRGERRRLMEATLGNSSLHEEVLRLLSTSRAGLRRSSIAQALEGDTTGSGSLNRTLDDLEKCGYIRTYINRYEKYKPTVYQLVDPFLLFSYRFMEGEHFSNWASFDNTPAYYAWRGLAFENVCMAHIEQIKRAIGIAAVQTDCFPWTSSRSDQGAQIDMVIERRDGVTDVCEIKYTDETFVPDEEFERSMKRKLAAFRNESATRAAVQGALISASGMKSNAHSWDVTAIVTADDLFAF